MNLNQKSASSRDLEEKERIREKRMSFARSLKRKGLLEPIGGHPYGDTSGYALWENFKPYGGTKT